MLAGAPTLFLSLSLRISRSSTVHVLDLPMPPNTRASESRTVCRTSFLVKGLPYAKLDNLKREREARREPGRLSIYEVGNRSILGRLNSCLHVHPHNFNAKVCNPCNFARRWVFTPSRHTFCGIITRRRDGTRIICIAT